MRFIEISNDNKAYIVRRYTDYVISRMDDIEVLDAFRNYFFQEKMSYPNDTLEEEIKKHCPEILEDHLSEEVIGKGAEYAKTIQ
jgi:hypothetical protein